MKGKINKLIRRTLKRLEGWKSPVSILLLCFGLTSYWMMGCIAFDMDFYQLAALDGWLTQTEAYLCANDGCNTAKVLWDSYEYMLAAETPDAHGTAIRQMLNALYEHPQQQAQLESLVRDHMGDSWFSMWVGQAIGPFVTGGWFTFFIMPVPPGNICKPWCNTAPADVPAPPGCVCGGVIS